MSKNQFEKFEEKVWLSSPTMHGDELGYMKEAFYTNWMSTVGKNINEVEKIIREKTGAKYAVGLGTGTAAIHLCAKLAGVKPGDKVFCSDMTFNATVNPAVYEMAEPIFIDSEYDTWNMDPKALEKAFELYPEVKVVIVANLYGTPAKLDEIKDICDKHGAILIEDAAESLGASYKGQPTGTFGTYNAISFNGNKIITGSAGGMLLTDDKDAATKARKWSTQSKDDAPWYQHTEMGYNYRISNVVAGVIRGQLPHLEEHIAQKKAIYERYKEGFKGLPIHMNPFNPETCVPNYWLSCITVDKEALCAQEFTDTKATYTKEPGKTCPTEILEVLRKMNSEGRPIWKPMHMQPLYEGTKFVSVMETPADEDIFARGLCLPSDNKMTPEDQDRIIEVVRACFDEEAVEVVDNTKSKGKVYNIPFSPPDISELEISYVADAMRSGWITTGPRTKELEKRLAAWIQNYDMESYDPKTNPPRCVCLNSATAALELSLRLLGIGPQEGGSEDDEVITCAYTYTASASTTCHVGAKLVLVDCSDKEGTIEMDYDALETAITENTKAIVPVDLAGIPCDYDKIFEIINRKKNLFKPANKIQEALGRIAVVTDGAHALGASYKGKMIGDIADFTDFSFHAVKNFTTAEGGALMWKHIDGIDDGEIYHQIQLYSLHGQSKDALAKTKPGAWEYDIVGTYYKCNMTDIMAAIGLAQLERYPEMLGRRREIIERYDKAFKECGIEVLEHYTDDYVGSGHLYIARVKGIDREKANEIMEKMAEKGISTNVHYKPLPRHTAYKKLGFDIKDYPNAEERFVNEITLPLHTKLTNDEVRYIVESFVECVR